MGDARKFVTRAPRYTLQPADNRYIRFSRQDESGRTHTTLFIDISTTGLAFVTDRENAPQLSDLIKVEIPLEDGQSIAWWARVVRVEEVSGKKWYMRKENMIGDHPVLIGVHFHELPAGHSSTIRAAVDKKFAELFRAQRTLKLQRFSFFMADQVWKIAMGVVLLIGAIYLLWWLSQPDANYDAQKGAPWGQRYPQFNIFGSGPDRDIREQLKKAEESKKAPEQ